MRDASEANLRNALCGFAKLGVRCTEQLLRDYLNLLHKQPRNAAYEVLLSDEICGCPIKFERCKGVAVSLSRGEPVARFLSARSAQSRFYDQALSHFGLHHLHLGKATQKAGARAHRAKGSKALLFARFEANTVYFIDVLDHSNFLAMTLVRTMHRNWPQILAPYKLNRVVALAQEYSDEEVVSMLRTNINVPVVLGSEVFMLPGQGETSAGTSAIVEMATNRLLDELDRLDLAAAVNGKCLTFEATDAGLVVREL